MTRMYPENVAITDQLLAALAEEAPLPVSTPQLIQMTGMPPAMQNTILRLLSRLVALGEVEKLEFADLRCRCWRRLTPVTDLPEVTR